MGQQRCLLRGFLAAAAVAITATAASAQTTYATLDELDAAVFKNFDADSSGSLDKTEVGAFRWGTYDRDQNGTVSRAEFLAGRKSDRSRADATPDHDEALRFLEWTGNETLSGLETDNGKWLKYDANNDGRVTKDEFVAGRTRERGKGVAAPPAPAVKPKPTAAAPAPPPKAPSAKAPSAKAPSAKAPPAQLLSTKTASGGVLYFKMVFRFNSFEQEHYTFLPDFRVYGGVPSGGLEYFDLAAAQAKYPKYVGTYSIRGGKMTIAWGGGAQPETFTYVEKEDGSLELDGLFVKKVARFAPGARLSGSYSWIQTVGGGTGAVVSAGATINFKPDGTFTASNIGGISVSVPGFEGGASAKEQSSGTYTLLGNTLILRRAGGGATRHTVYPQGEGEKTATPQRLFMDGGLMRRQ